ncbi:MAG: transposase [Candidatus Thiodiazotropha sp.]
MAGHVGVRTAHPQPTEGIAKVGEPENRQIYGKRQGMVEPVFSQLKCCHGLRRFRRKGLKAVRCEFALHAMAFNLRRAVALRVRIIKLIINVLDLDYLMADGKCHLY